MADTQLRFVVERIPYTAAAKNTLGYGSTPFRVIADTEGGAIAKAKSLSKWDITAFKWRVTSVEEVPATPTEGTQS